MYKFYNKEDSLIDITQSNNIKAEMQQIIDETYVVKGGKPVEIVVQQLTEP